jgi:hypothetical protein
LGKGFRNPSLLFFKISKKHLGRLSLSHTLIKRGNYENWFWGTQGIILPSYMESHIDYEPEKLS